MAKPTDHSINGVSSLEYHPKKEQAEQGEPESTRETSRTLCGPALDLQGGQRSLILCLRVELVWTWHLVPDEQTIAHWAFRLGVEDDPLSTLLLPYPSASSQLIADYSERGGPLVANHVLEFVA